MVDELLKKARLVDERTFVLAHQVGRNATCDMFWCWYRQEVVTWEKESGCGVINTSRWWVTEGQEGTGRQENSYRVVNVSWLTG